MPVIVSGAGVPVVVTYGKGRPPATGPPRAVLQNAHDSHLARARDGRVKILLDEDEGEDGTPCVANGAVW